MEPNELMKKEVKALAADMIRPIRIASVVIAAECPEAGDLLIDAMVEQLEKLRKPKEQAEGCTCHSEGPGAAKCECGEATEASVPAKPGDELMGTVQLMGSEDYKDRFRAEYYQTKIRYDKLHKMCVKYEAGKLDFTPNCELDLLKEQKAAMGHYLHCLEVRAQIEGVVL